MNNYIEKFKLTNTTIFKQQVLQWANSFNTCCVLDNNHYDSTYNSFECLIAVSDTLDFESSKSNHVLNDLNSFIEKNIDWIFGHFNYDFKNYIFPFQSNNIDGINSPEVCLFVPEVLIQIKKNIVTIESKKNNTKEVFNTINSIELSKEKSIHQSSIQIQSRFNKEEYCSTINTIKNHIQLGDCYEMNFCMEFFAEEIQINPLEVFQKLNIISPTPFAAFYKFKDTYLLCASPERFIKKMGNNIISQPIKGTIRRDLKNIENDKKLEQSLQQNPKEKSENVMIVDLVRNDLSKVAARNSVEVIELCKIYSFPQVHQMISTITATLKENISFIDILKATFPMGSMTGAPKYKVMQLIEQYEKSKRGIYSGCVGYITPNKDFDFNVVIRSVVYNKQKSYLSYQVGSAITINSEPEQEYQECLLKASAIEHVLKS